MAQVMRIPEPDSLGSFLRHKVIQVNGILGRAEKMLGLAGDYDRQGAQGPARIFRKKARDKAKIAMKLMGVLVWHHGLDLSSQIAKAKAISHGQAAGEAKNA